MKRWLVIFGILALALAAISCSPVQTSRSSAGSQPVPFATVAPAFPAQPAAPPAPAEQPYGAGGRDAAQDSGNSVPSAASADRMIVYTVQVNIEVQDTDKAVNDISAVMTRYNGYIAATNMSRDSNGQMRGSLTVRVPAESLDAVQRQIEEIGLKVLSRSRNSNDVTDQYTDLNARLTNLQATEDELRKLLDTVRERTGKAEDILAVYNRLTEIRGQIEQIKGQMNVLSKTSTFATMTISLTPRAEIQVVEPEGWLPNQTAREALRSLVQTLQGLGDLLIWVLLYLLPLLILFILPFLILALLIRALVRGRSKKPVLPST